MPQDCRAAVNVLHGEDLLLHEGHEDLGLHVQLPHLSVHGEGPLCLPHEAKTFEK